MINNTLQFQWDKIDIEMYREFADIEEIKKVAANLKDIKILHINSVLSGGGVSAILSRIIPVFRKLGVSTTWHVPEPGTGDFFKITKKQHNMLQGINNGVLTKSEKDLYNSLRSFEKGRIWACCF